jgi:xylan 1,4-beta-xylosidase
LSGRARADWEERISLRSDRAAPSPGPSVVPDLPPPLGLTAVGGVGQVTLSWEPVDGAVGYLVHRSPADSGPFLPVDHHGGDVLAVPHPPYLDTTGEVGTQYWYAVASVAEVTVTGSLGPAVPARAVPATGTPPALRVTVDAADAGAPLCRPWQPMIGSERLSQVLSPDLSGGRVIGEELRAALARMHDEIGVESVRAHAILHDDTAVYREVDGRPIHDFSVIDRIYDTVTGVGLDPVVEVGFMPRDLASDPGRTVFAYHAIISPPKDYDRWGDLVRALAQHLVDRYGRERVVRWAFEVWNEANLEVFWSGTRQEWFHLYDVTAAALKSVDGRIAVGGPSSAAAGWVDDLLAHCRASGSPVDFVSTHTYGSPPLDLRASLARYGFEHARILWTEWGVTPRHFDPINDSVFSGVFLLRGMKSAAGRLDALSYWVASDHFEELGPPPRLLHGGFGLLTVGNLPKPRFHALRLLSRLGEREIPVRADGDGAGSLVEAWASRATDGRIAVLLWNLTLDQAKASGDPALTRRVGLTLLGVDGEWLLRQTRLAQGCGDLADAVTALNLGGWPADEAQWTDLARASELPVIETTVTALGQVEVELTLTMPSAVLIELAPA